MYNIQELKNTKIFLDFSLKYDTLKWKFEKVWELFFKKAW